MRKQLSSEFHKEMARPLIDKPNKLPNYGINESEQRSPSTNLSIDRELDNDMEMARQLHYKLNGPQHTDSTNS